MDLFLVGNRVDEVEMCKGFRPQVEQNGEIETLREALGVVAVAQPAVYWLYADDAGRWRIRREGDIGERDFETRELALAAIRLAVARCASYRLYLQGDDGRFVTSHFNWESRSR